MEYIYDNPTRPPQESRHWQSLRHETGDRFLTNPELLRNELLHQITDDNDDNAILGILALLGYCEALCTGRERYHPYPIPVDALGRLVEEEFTPPVVVRPTQQEQRPGTASTPDQHHRRAAREISNWIFTKVVSKTNMKDEKHANSMYTVLRGRIDNKSVDCFGAAIVTVVALRQQNYSSVLTLSEDHAYESHGDNGTCEVAIPGNTKVQKQKRGQDIAETFSNQNRTSSLTPDTSWLYMGGNAVMCNTNAMILAAAIANMNCLIENKSNHEMYSRPLLLIKRDLLWILKDKGHLDRFPFALCELGWAEEHATSRRGEARVAIPWERSSNIEVTTMEALYHDAVRISQTNYRDKQVYPYCYLGFFHKDGGQEEEYRLGLALQFFSEAARVASSYKYESGDTLQLTKVFTKISEFIVNEIMSYKDKPRTWQDTNNEITCGKWLIVFFDYLFLWEEQSDAGAFLPICKSNHKTGIVKAFAQLSTKSRIQCVRMTTTKSQRFQGPLRSALESPTKLSISDMHLTIVSDSKRRRKRKAIS